MKPLKLGKSMIEIPIDSGKTLYNNCAVCENRWQVIGDDSHLTWDDITLDETDKENLKEYGQLFSTCEDCSESGECESYSVGAEPIGGNE
jgi:hypothetical protein